MFANDPELKAKTPIVNGVYNFYPTAGRMEENNNQPPPFVIKKEELTRINTNQPEDRPLEQPGNDCCWNTSLCCFIDCGTAPEPPDCSSLDCNC
jgi:hypothetical protein